MSTTTIGWSLAGWLLGGSRSGQCGGPSRQANDVGDARATPHTSEDTEAQLLSRIRAGDYAAFETVFRRYATSLLAFVSRYLHSRDDAHDVVQELFLALWTERESWHVAGSLEHYLHASARNRALNRIKANAVRQRWRETHASVSPVLPVPTPDDLLTAADESAAFVHALGILPERRRAVCLLRWGEGLSYAEIGQRLGISEKTVKTQLARAMPVLRTAFHRAREEGWLD